MKFFVVGGAEVDRQPFLRGVLMRSYELQVNQNFFYLRVGLNGTRDLILSSWRGRPSPTLRTGILRYRSAEPHEAEGSSLGPACLP